MTTPFVRLPSPLLTVNRLLAMLLIGTVSFFLVLYFEFLFITLYGVLLVATILVVRSVPVQPGEWLSRRVVRRGLVIGISIVTLAIVAGANFPGSFILLILLGLGDVALGRATQRIGSAETTELDERQEVVRNRAHRIAYPILSVSVSAVILVTATATPESRQWLGDAMKGLTGPVIGFIELLFFLPAMVIAWLEPDRLVDPEAPQITSGMRGSIASTMVALCVLTPFILSLTVFVMPIRTSAYTQPQQVYGPAPGAAPTEQCSYFGAKKQVGYGLSITLPISAVACWNGTRAYEQWGLNAYDCNPSSSALVISTTTACRRTTEADGTLRYTYATLLSSPFLPFVERDVTMTLVLTKDGKVVQFP